MVIKRIVLSAVAYLGLAACGTNAEPVDGSDAAVEVARAWCGNGCGGPDPFQCAVRMIPRLRDSWPAAVDGDAYDDCLAALDAPCQPDLPAECTALGE